MFLYVKHGIDKDRHTRHVTTYNVRSVKPMFDGLMSKISLLHPMHKFQDTYLLVTRKWGVGEAINYTYCHVYKPPVTNRPEERTHTHKQPESN
jgi:hypothetical protein